ncbi:hypothetical protein ACSNN7_13785 [Micromonospora sp. URMC 105]|uniref:hypothetical protein n=1 Tax=Micromonospora sp. URMC 105 TaxID=3423413 RepID=UPI003F1A6A3F
MTARTRRERGYEMASDDATWPAGGTEPPPHHRRPHRRSRTRPGGSRPERARLLHSTDLPLTD